MHTGGPVCAPGLRRRWRSGSGWNSVGVVSVLNLESSAFKRRNGDHAMTNVTMKSDSYDSATDTAAHLFDNWFDPIESGLRERVREFIEALICGELDAALARPRYGRAKNDDACSAGVIGHRHGSRTRSLTGSFGKTEITVPRARLQTSDGRNTEWHSKSLRTYQRRTLTADALIASAYLAGTNTRRVRRALGALFRDAVSKD